MAIAPAKPRSGLATHDKVWTQEEFRLLPEGPPYYEFEDGVLVEMTQPTKRHQKINLRLGSLLDQHVDTNQLGEVYPEVEVDLSGTKSYVPDIVFLKSESADKQTDSRMVVGAPDLVVEILSNSTQSRDWGVKRKVYGRMGVAHYWIVSQELTIWELINTGEAFEVAEFVDKGEDFRPKLFPNLAINLAQLMGELPSEAVTKDSK